MRIGGIFLATTGVLAALGLGIAFDWLIGMTIAYWVGWSIAVERTVGLRRFVFFDFADEPPRDSPSWRWACWLLVGLVLGGGLLVVALQFPDMRMIVVAALALLTLYTGWAVRAVKRRIRAITAATPA